jgi:hypothetical protein
LGTIQHISLVVAMDEVIASTWIGPLAPAEQSIAASAAPPKFRAKADAQI